MAAVEVASHKTATACRAIGSGTEWLFCELCEQPEREIGIVTLPNTFPSGGRSDLEAMPASIILREGGKCEGGINAAKLLRACGGCLGTDRR